MSQSLRHCSTACTSTESSYLLLCPSFMLDCNVRNCIFHVSEKRAFVIIEMSAIHVSRQPFTFWVLMMIRINKQYNKPFCPSSWPAHFLRGDMT